MLDAILRFPRLGGLSEGAKARYQQTLQRHKATSPSKLTIAVSAGLALERLGVDHQPRIHERSGICLIYVNAQRQERHTLTWERDRALPTER